MLSSNLEFGIKKPSSNCDLACLVVMRPSRFAPRLAIFYQKRPGTLIKKGTNLREGIVKMQQENNPLPFLKLVCLYTVNKKINP